MHMKGKSQALRANLFDASALVKVYVDETHSDVVKEFQWTLINQIHDSFLLLRGLKRFEGEVEKEECSRRHYVRSVQRRSF